MRPLGICSYVHTLRCSLSERFMKFVDDLLEAVRGDILAMGAEEVQLNVPFAQRHLQICITTAITVPMV